MDQNILNEIYCKAPELNEKDVDELIPKLIDHYRVRLNSLCREVYRDNISSLSYRAFEESARGKLSRALKTFLEKRHWEAGRDLNSYLLKALQYLGTEIYWNNNDQKRSSIHICMACKELGTTSYVQAEDEHYRCRECTRECDRLTDELKRCRNNAQRDQLQYRLDLCSAFALHSKSGFSCPDCYKWIPESLSKNGIIACPFGKCSFFGSITALERFQHPTVRRAVPNQMVSIDATTVNREDGSEVQNATARSLTYCTMELDEKILISENFEKEFAVLKDVIEQQLQRVERMNQSGAYQQKLLMYYAFLQMLDDCPTEMTAYLCHMNQNTEFPIQCRIFQRYLSLIEDSLPFWVEKKGQRYEIMSITDPVLDIFECRSEFESVVEAGGTIQNRTQEHYVGGSDGINYGANFLGKLISIVDLNTGESLIKKVSRYSFSKIEMKDVEAGTPVKVVHLSLPSHWELRNLVYLQRIRRAIVDKCYLRIHGSRRKVNQSKVSAA